MSFSAVSSIGHSKTGLWNYGCKCKGLGHNIMYVYRLVLHLGPIAVYCKGIKQHLYYKPVKSFGWKPFKGT